MSAAVADPPKLLTAEEYLALPDDGKVTELVRGVVVEYPFGTGIHGFVCANVGSALAQHVRDRGLGWTIQRAGLITRRNPDSVRGPDVAYFSYSRIPRGRLPRGYPEVMPEVLFEVVDPSDDWNELFAKIEEYHTAGAVLVVVADTVREVVMVFRRGEQGVVVRPSETLTFPGVLPDLQIPVGPLFA